MKQLDYPDDAYDIFVIADNCDDNTAKAAEDAGALVYVRNVPELRGKGHALEWMFDKLYKMDEQYDYISVFDADNLVDKNYLKAMNERANQGFKVVQGFLDSKNPYDFLDYGSLFILFLECKPYISAFKIQTRSLL